MNPKGGRESGRVFRGLSNLACGQGSLGLGEERRGQAQRTTTGGQPTIAPPVGLFSFIIFSLSFPPPHASLGSNSWAGGLFHPEKKCVVEKEKIRKRKKKGNPPQAHLSFLGFSHHFFLFSSTHNLTNQRTEGGRRPWLGGGRRKERNRKSMKRHEPGLGWMLG